MFSCYSQIILLIDSHKHKHMYKHFAPSAIPKVQSSSVKIWQHNHPTWVSLKNHLSQTLAKPCPSIQLEPEQDKRARCWTTSVHFNSSRATRSVCLSRRESTRDANLNSHKLGKMKSWQKYGYYSGWLLRRSGGKRSDGCSTLNFDEWQERERER